MKPWIITARRRMKDLGVKQADLIRVLGVTTRGAVGHYLTGRRDLDGEQMHALAQFLGLTVEELQGSPVDSVSKQLDELGFKSPKEATIRNLLTAARELEPD
jgi:transcriptional regulator with XRE-family HTH domain